MSKLFVRRAFAPGVSALGLLLAAGQAMGQTDTSWINAAGGNWSELGNWSAGVPSGNFNAIIDLLDPVDGYTVTMDGNFSIVGFQFDSPDAILNLTNNALDLTGVYFQRGGMIVGTIGGTGTIQTGIGQSATLRDTALMHVSSFQSRGTLNIDGGTLFDVCDTGIDHSGTACSWTGGGDIRLNGASTWTVGAASTFTVGNDASLFSTNLPGNAPSFVLNGMLEKNGGAGLTFVNNVAVTNNGMVRATTGTFRFDTVTNYSAGTLTGGDWRVNAGATLDLTGLAISTNRANVTLDGAGSTFTQVDALATNDTTGSFTISGGRSYSTGVPAFMNAGTLGIGAGSTFTAPGANSITNAAGTISGGGTLLAQGALNLQGGTYSAVTVRNISTTTISGAADAMATDTVFQFQGTSVAWTGGGDIVLNGTSSILNDAGSTFTISNAEPIRSDNLPGSLPVFTNNGTVLVSNATPGTSSLQNVRLNNLGTIPAPGTVEVQGGHAFSAPDVVNVSAGVLTGGRWRVVDNSVLDFGTQSITTNRSDVILRGGNAAAQFPRLQGFLALNDTLGKLTLEAAETYITAGNFTNMGRITVDGTAGASSFAVPFGFTLTNYTPGNKKLTGGQILLIGEGRASATFEVPGLDIENIDADVTLSGVGANMINVNNPDPDALRNLNTIDNAGRFVIRNGKNFLTLANFSVNPTGELGVGMDSEFEVPAQGSARLTNFDELSGEFNDGTFTVSRGRVIAPNIRVRVLNNSVTLDGPGNVGFFRRGPDMLINGLENLERIGSPGRTGEFTISGGHELELLPAPGHNLLLLDGSRLTIGTAESPGGRLRIPRDPQSPEDPGGNFQQAGQLNMNGGLLEIGGDWIQAPSASCSLVASQINVGGSFQQDGSCSIVGLVNAAGSFDVNGELHGNATFNTGSGNFVLTNGILSPGMSAGTMNIGGVADFIFLRGRFDMEILGPAAGIDYDQINILHTLMFAGPDEKQLVVSVGNGYVPPLGATFDLVTFGEGRVGNFTEVQLPVLPFGRSFDRQDTLSSVRLVVIPAPGSSLVLGALGLVARRRRR